MSRYVLAVVFLCLPVFVSAQPDPLYPGTSDAVILVPSVGSFFVALIAGLILAVAFQLILTNLSVAAGLNILGNVTSPDADRSEDKDKDTSSDTSVAGTVKKLNTAFGIWALVTASIALFFASWLAVGLSLTTSATIGAIIGLVIWGLFYTFMMTIEASALSSLVGSLGRMAISGLRTAYEGVSSIFSKSEETKAADTAGKITAAVREELFGDVDMSDVTKQIQKYVNQLTPQKFDVKQIRQELAKLLDDTEIRAISSHDGTLLDTEMIVASLKNRGMEEGSARSVVRGVEQALGTFKEEKNKNKDKVSMAVDTGLRVAGLSPDEARATREKFERYLRETGKEELNPEGIKRDIEKLFSSRKEGMAALKDRISHIDKSTAVAVLSQRTDMTEEEAQRIVDQVERVLNQVTAGVSGVAAGTSDLRASVTGKVKNYLDSLERPELNYEGIESDMQKLFHDPKAGGEALLRRLKSVNRDTIKAILASREDMTEEDAERVITRIESARDNVVGKVEQMGTEVKRRLEAAKDEALHQADEARKIAATAAWWAFASAVVSGIAAVLGGVVAAMTT